MDIENFRDYCLSKNGTSESMPFGENTLVFKVKDKIFALLALDSHPASANLKCDPEKALDLREEYDGIIIPGYHMNKKHWNTIQIEGPLPTRMLLELIDHSYELVVKGLSKKLKSELNNMKP